MSRKDSRSSIGTRQPDALAEYENRRSTRRILISSHTHHEAFDRQEEIPHFEQTHHKVRKSLCVVTRGASNLLLARLNSELSVRVDELSNDIKNLQSENLRLRQTVISLVAHLKRERAKSRKILADTELAVRSSFLPGAD
jgi:U3 small nucleolar ribonucleoprotein component